MTDRFKEKDIPLWAIYGAAGLPDYFFYSLDESSASRSELLSYLLWYYDPATLKKYYRVVTQ